MQRATDHDHFGDHISLAPKPFMASTGSAVVGHISSSSSNSARGNSGSCFARYATGALTTKVGLSAWVLGMVFCHAWTESRLVFPGCNIGTPRGLPEMPVGYHRDVSVA
jgi:hypothetical protein